MVYTPEDGISLKLLQEDVEFLRQRYNLDVKGKSEGRLVIKWVIFHPRKGEDTDEVDPKNHPQSTTQTS